MDAISKPDFVTFNYKGIEFLTFPQACKFIGLEDKRDALHQRMIRNKDGRTLKVGRYVFVSLSYCEELKIELLKRSRKEKLSILSELDLSDEEIQKIVEMKKKNLPKK